MPLIDIDLLHCSGEQKVEISSQCRVIIELEELRVEHIDRKRRIEATVESTT